jgi:hypothetical protein
MSNSEPPSYPGPGGESPYGAPQQPQQGNPYDPQQPPQQPAYGQPQYPQPPYQQNPYAQQPWQQPSGYPPNHPYQPTPPNDGLGLAAMVIGIVSLVLMCGYGLGLLGSPAALIMGRISMNRIDRSEGRLGGRGMAQAGFILGIVGTVLLVLAIAAIIVIIAIAASGGFDDTTYR